MEGSTVRIHYCFKQHLGEKFDPENCKCKEYVTYSEAEYSVAQGRADWVILSRTEVGQNELGKFNEERGRFNLTKKALEADRYVKTCPMCAKFTDAQKRVCKNCQGRGYQDPVLYWEELSRWQLPEPGGQIVAVSQADEKGRYGLALHKKTPRVATIERAHVVRAYLDGRWEAQQRIEDYHRVNILELYGKPANGPLNDKKIEFALEPEDVPGDKNHDAQGRKYDWGRGI
jgi:hypothetical protein